MLSWVVAGVLVQLSQPWPVAPGLPKAHTAQESARMVQADVCLWGSLSSSPFVDSLHTFWLRGSLLPQPLPGKMGLFSFLTPRLGFPVSAARAATAQLCDCSQLGQAGREKWEPSGLPLQLVGAPFPGPLARERQGFSPSLAVWGCPQVQPGQERENEPEESPVSGSVFRMDPPPQCACCGLLSRVLR